MRNDMNEICRCLESKGFELMSQPGYRIQIYLKGAVTVAVEDKSQRPK